jgi:hypothetical protein
MSSTRTDGGDGQGEQYADLWDRVGRKAAAMEVEGARCDVDEVMEELVVETMFQGDDPTPEQIRAARRALNGARRALEEYVAPAAGCDEWGDPIPEMPYGRYREIAGCSDADTGEETDE